MSVSLQEGQSIQFSDNNGNISHQGVLGSNINQTSSLSSTFPTTSTGTSLGHYHYTEPITNALKFLNCSGTGSGGHQFFTANSTTAPIKTATFDINGLTIEKDNTITNYNTVGTITSAPTFIILNTNPSASPYNFILGQMYVVQVGNTTATMSIGVNYNVKYIDTQALRVFTTSSDTSPVIDSSGITSVLLPTGTSGQIDTSILSSTDLTFNGKSVIQPIIDDNFVIYSTGTTIEGNADFQHKSNTGIISINQDLNFTSDYPIGIETAFNENTFTTALLAQNKDSGDTSSISILLTNDIGTDSAYYGGLTMYSSTSNPQYEQFASMKNALILNTQSSSIVISAWNGQQHGTEAEDANIMLTYDGGSKAHIINNNGQLIIGADNPDFSGGTYGGDNGGTDSVLTSDGTNGLKWVPTVALLGIGEENQVLTYNNNSCGWADPIAGPVGPAGPAGVDGKQINQLNIYNSASVYQDGKPPIAIPSTIINDRYNNFNGGGGWYFKNSFTSGNKVNWYIPPNAGMLVSDILGLYLRFFNVSAISTTPNDMPFINVYTKTNTTTPNYASWYKSRMVYIPNFIPTTNTSYTTFRKISSTCSSPNTYASSLQLMIDSTVAPNPAGTYASNEEILFFAISTSSSSVINCSEFILQKFGIIMTSNTQEFNFQQIL